MLTHEYITDLRRNFAQNGIINSWDHVLYKHESLTKEPKKQFATYFKKLMLLVSCGYNL